jgi:hypothetical protein
MTARASVPPLYTPADRLDALHEVAEAARQVRDELRAGVLPFRPIYLPALEMGLDRLERIEAYLGVRVSA